MNIYALPQTQIITGTFTSFELLLAATPVLLLILLLGILKIAGEKSAIFTLIVTIFIAVWGYHYSLSEIGLTLVYGVLKAVFPILIIILMAIFSYNVQVYTQKMEVIKDQFSSISTNKSIQVLLLTWGFGGLLEGMAGFGTAVAIPAAILISLGFKPIFSAVASLIANSVATGFGAVGTPIIVLAREIGMSEHLQSISSDVVIQLSVLMFLIPFILVTLADRRLSSIPGNIFLSLLVGGVSLIVQYYSALLIGAETPAILGSLASIIVIITIGKLKEAKKRKNKIIIKYSFKEIIRAWSVYGLILIFILLTGPLLSIKKYLDPIVSYTFNLNIYDAISQSDKIRHIKISLIDTGILLFLGSILGGLIQGARLRNLLSLLMTTLLQLKKTIITVSGLITLSTIMDFSGMIGVLGVSLAAATSYLYPLFAPLIGCLGTFLTGSDTSSNILFGKLQTTVADRIGADKGWLAAANASGATGGKIISPQSIAVATSSCGQQGKEGEIMKKAFPYALLYIIVAGLIVYFGR